MALMPYNEADTRAKLIDPAIYKRGWIEHQIRSNLDRNEPLPASAVSARTRVVDYNCTLPASPHRLCSYALEACRRSSSPDLGATSLCYPFVDHMWSEL